MPRSRRTRAGEEQKGWQFFRTHYKPIDIVEVERGVKERPKQSAIYCATYGCTPEEKTEPAAR